MKVSRRGTSRRPTVRHNMARGTHQVELSAELVTALKKHNWTNERNGMELCMDPDEVLRLKQITGTRRNRRRSIPLPTKCMEHRL